MDICVMLAFELCRSYEGHEYQEKNKGAQRLRNCTATRMLQLKYLHGLPCKMETSV